MAANFIDSLSLFRFSGSFSAPDADRSIIVGAQSLELFSGRCDSNQQLLGRSYDLRSGGNNFA